MLKKFSYFKLLKLYFKKQFFIKDSILFLCEGNICRSPFAERLANKLAPKLAFYSAGINVNIPASPPIEAVVAAKYFDIDISNHISRPVNKTMLKEYDLIVIMDPFHLKKLLFLHPLAEKKVFLLSTFYPNIKGRLKIEDPYGKDFRSYIKCFTKISICIRNFLYQLIKNDN